MKPFDSTHLLLLFATVAFVALTMWIISKLSRTGQNVMFAVGAIICAGGVFLRYAVGLPSVPAGKSFSEVISILGDWAGHLPPLNIEDLLIQLTQVCNFNFVLVLLMLVPKFELARQYSIMFSMFAAATVMLSFPSSWQNLEWYYPTVMNFWLNHVFAIALPLWMLAAGRLKPQKKYIIPVAVCVVVYFLAVYGCGEWMIASGRYARETVYTDAFPYTFSYVYKPDGIGMGWLKDLIPFDCLYLAPLIPPMLGFFWVLYRIFRGYPVMPYGKKENKM